MNRFSASFGKRPCRYFLVFLVLSIVLMCMTFTIHIAFVQTDIETEFDAENPVGIREGSWWDVSAEAISSAKWRTSPVNIVHYIKIYKNGAPNITDRLCYLECVSLFSVIENLKPNKIYVHTNYPDFWPFDSCNDVIKNWSVPIHMLFRQRTFVVGGKRVHAVHHQADMLKLEVLIEYGGIVMDMDIFIIQGYRIVKALEKFECVTSREGTSMMNAGFTACHKGAEYPALVLDHYAKDYRSNWTYNSGKVPWKIYNASKSLQKKIFVDRTISDNPPGWKNGQMLKPQHRGKIKWRKKIAYQSFFHNCSYNLENVLNSTSSFGDLLRWLLKIDN